MSVESDALIAAAQASTDLTAIAATAINNLAEHEAEEAKHIDWAISGAEKIDPLRLPVISDGDDGDSAYAIAVEGGFVGTKADWLLTLVGADGALNLTQLNYALRGSLRNPSTIPSTADVIMIASLGEFQFNPTFYFLDDDEIAFEVLDPSDGTTPVGQWVMTTPAYEWTEAQEMFFNAVLWERWEDEQLRFNTY
jgi:hypothetical protein